MREGGRKLARGSEARAVERRPFRRWFRANGGVPEFVLCRRCAQAAASAAAGGGQSGVSSI